MWGNSTWTEYEKESVHRYEHNFGVECILWYICVKDFAIFKGVINETIICEVKCPYSAKNKDISPITVPYLKLEDGNLILSTTHKYYYQVQGPLFC